VRNSRIACPVLTCTRDMQAGSIMCAHCWGRVPKDLRKAVGLMPELPTPYLFLAKSLSEQGTADRLREAVEAYTLCLEKDPDREDQFLGHYGRGQAWLRLGEYRKAEEDFTETLKIKRHFAGAYQDRAFVRKKLGDAEGAKLDAKRAHELSLSPE